MKRLPLILMVPLLGLIACSAQSVDALHLQVHGFAAQAFIYSTDNNWDTTESSDVSAAWTEAALNVTAQPRPRLRLAVQARYFRLGTIGNKVTLDFASVDFKVNEHFGIRAGKVRTPTGLLNESQDIDPAHLWVLLPQSVYPVASRNSFLAHDGAVVYGKVTLSELLGSLEYRGYGGERFVSGDDGFLQPARDSGFTLPRGLVGKTYGASLRWNTPVRGLLLGATMDRIGASGTLVGPYFRARVEGELRFRSYYFGRFERNKIMLAGEYSRLPIHEKVKLSIGGSSLHLADERTFYVMGSYKLAKKLTGGAYYSSGMDRQLPVSSGRFQKDWVLAGRYDVNSFLYLKVEEHFMNGTFHGYSTSDNPHGLKPKTDMSLVKLGVSF